MEGGSLPERGPGGIRDDPGGGLGGPGCAARRRLRPGAPADGGKGGGALFFYEDRPDGAKGCTAVRADDAGAFYVDGVGPLGAPWEEVRRAIEGLGGDWVAWEEGIASFPLGMIVTAPSSPLRTSAFACRAPELEAQVMRGLCRELEMDPAVTRSVGEAIDHGERGIAFEALYDAWERGPRGTNPLRCAEALRRMAEMLGFREEAEALYSSSLK